MQPHHILRPLLTTALIALAAAPTAACKPRSSSSRTAPASSAASSGEKLSSLESHLKLGTSWGGDAVEKKLAAEVFRALDSDYPQDEIAVAVSIIRTEPRQVVIVAQLKNLKSEGKENRKDVAEWMRESLEDGLVPNDEVTFGIRGGFAYGVVAHGPAKGKWETKVGSVVSNDPLERALAKATSATGAPAVAKKGEAFRASNIEWTVTEATDKGKSAKGDDGETAKTTGRFVVLKLKATNRGKKPLTLESAPSLSDAKGRVFGARNDDDALLRSGAKRYHDGTLQPDLPFEFEAAYEVPADATELKIRVGSGYDFGDARSAELGI